VEGGWEGGGEQASKQGIEFGRKGGAVRAAVGGGGEEAA